MHWPTPRRSEFEPTVQLAIDIGGTFTDVVASGPRGIAAVKVPSSRADPVAAVESGIAAIAAIAGIDPAAVTRFVHGTTVATNAVLTRRGARIGLLATAGFEDVIEIGRQKRSRMYDLFQEPETPVFLAPKRRRVGIVERIGVDGGVIEPLDEDGVREAIRLLVERHRIEALAVAYLFSFRNATHERRTREIAGEIAPGLPVSLSCEIDPVFREYERTCVTAFDAYVRPVMTGYVERLAAGLARVGVTAPVEMMQSRGAVADAARILERPVVALLSGPAAGALGGAVAGSRAGHVRCVTLDMGGTSTDIAVINDGRMVATREGRIGGFPLRVQMVDVHTIGAGGGSIARIDDGGALKVGPESAEADPGPACYGRGGTAATVTDASLVLGLLDPTNFAGGIRLDRGRAAKALAPIATDLGSPIRAAHGVLTVCNEAMAEAIRAVTVRRGIDPRGFALVALGGAGPVHAGQVARALAMSTVVVPMRPGVLAAEGLLHAPVEEERHATFFRPALAATAAALREALDLLADATRAQLASQPDYIRFAADMRYVGQSYELEVAVDPAGDAVADAVEKFHLVYRSAYGHAQVDAPVEFVTLRAVAGQHRRAPVETAASQRAAAPATFRPVWFSADNDPANTPVFDRATLPRDWSVRGPAIVEQSDTTTVVYPGQVCRLHDSGALILTWTAA
jgi:N-methylhydantoinase A/oxoprolinase/acetone carboxylase beta subunit